MATVTHSTAASGSDDPSGGQISKNAWDAGHTIVGDLLTGGSLILLEQHTASSSATLDFTTFTSAAYDTYVFELVNVKPANDNVYLYTRCSTDGGANFDATSVYDTAAGYYYVSNVGVAGAAGDNLSAMRLLDTIGNGGSYSVSGKYTLYEPLSTSKYKTLTGQGHMYHATVGKIVGISSSHVYKSTTAVNAIRFLFSSGNIASGTIRVYGVAQTVGTGSGPVLLEQHTASSSATLDFTTCISAAYDEYMIEIGGIRPATNNVNFRCAMSSDGGSNWNTSSNYYSSAAYILNSGSAGGTNYSGANPTTIFILADGVNTLAGRSFNATLRLYSPQSTTLDKVLIGPIAWTNQANSVAATFGGLLTVSGTAFNAMQFSMSSGNIASGTIRVYGIPKT